MKAVYVIFSMLPVFYRTAHVIPKGNAGEVATKQHFPICPLLEYDLKKKRFYDQVGSKVVLRALLIN